VRIGQGHRLVILLRSFFYWLC